MSVAVRTLAVIALTAALSPALAQDPKPPAPKQDAPADAPAATDSAAALQRLAELYPRVLQKPPEAGSTPLADPKARVESAKRLEAWRAAVNEMNKAADAYARALGDAAPDLTGLYYRGYAKAVAADLAPSGDVRSMCDAAADALGRFLGAADEKSSFRGDAEMQLGWVLLRSGKGDDAVAHLGRAVDLLQKDKRHDDAGRCAADALRSLQRPGREADLRKFADAVHAADADFGRSTPTVRRLAAAAMFTVGAPLPALPDVKDVDGKPVSWRPGKPMLVHFFLTAQIDGTATSYREIELEVRPLWEKYREKGLAFVGVSMDRELPAGEAERRRKEHAEWGDKTEIRDGSLATVREWAVKKGIEWPWCWDGKALLCPISLALGGVGSTEPYAVLVDKDGVVRWKGKAPFTGLPDEIAKLLP
jgi:tetratricopeptide (TPR) repeat protein